MDNKASKLESALIELKFVSKKINHTVLPALEYVNQVLNDHPEFLEETDRKFLSKLQGLLRKVDTDTLATIKVRLQENMEVKI